MPNSIVGLRRWDNNWDEIIWNHNVKSCHFSALVSSLFQFDRCNQHRDWSGDSWSFQNAVKHHSNKRQSKHCIGNMRLAEHSLMYFTWHLGSVKASQRISQQAVELEIQYRWERSTECVSLLTQVCWWRHFLIFQCSPFCLSSFMLPLNESSCKQSIAHTRARTHTYTLLLRPGNHKLCLSPYQTSH